MWEVVDEDPPWSEYEKDPLTALIDEQAGVVAGRQASRFLSEKAIRHRVSSGRWRRVHPGVYLTRGGPLTLAQRHWVAVLAIRPAVQETASARLGGISALQVHGLRGISTDRVHVIVGARREVTAPPGTTVHKRQLCEEDCHPYSRPPTTTLGRAVVDAAAWARSDREAQLVIAASVQQRLVTAPEILRVLDRLPVTKRRRLVVLTVRDVAAGSHSLGEIDLVRLCRSARLPLPTRQVRFVDAAGRRRYLDAVFDPWRVAVEVDGAQHDEVAQTWDDMQRDNDVALAGFTVLRYPLYVVRQEPGRVATQLRVALERAGWRAGQ